jgi:hypothetical protein
LSSTCVTRPLCRTRRQRQFIRVTSDLIYRLRRAEVETPGPMIQALYLLSFAALRDFGQSRAGHRPERTARAWRIRRRRRRFRRLRHQFRVAVTSEVGTAGNEPNAPPRAFAGALLDWLLLFDPPVEGSDLNVTHICSLSSAGTPHGDEKFRGAAAVGRGAGGLRDRAPAGSWAPWQGLVGITVRGLVAGPADGRRCAEPDIAGAGDEIGPALPPHQRIDVAAFRSTSPAAVAIATYAMNRAKGS